MECLAKYTVDHKMLPENSVGYDLFTHVIFSDATIKCDNPISFGCVLGIRLNKEENYSQMF